MTRSFRPSPSKSQNGFDDFEGVLRTLLVGVAACFALVVVLRSSGKRTLSKMNAFDLVVTVAARCESAFVRSTPITPSRAGGIGADAKQLALHHGEPLRGHRMSRTACSP
jgi:hypothetical protein